MAMLGRTNTEHGLSCHAWRGPNMAVADFRNAIGVVVLEWGSATYHRAAAARARRLLEEATTRRLKERLTQAVIGHENVAAAIERACDLDAG
jgi:hypothetical protein